MRNLNKSQKLSALARLMAGENIAVVHDPKMHTAMFGLRARKLVLPVWKDMSPELYDMLLAHEISHAKHTPYDGWHTAIKNNGRSREYHGYLNVLEDVRIERLIKKEYPGVQRTFATAYRELLQRDFFGIKKYKLDLATSPLIDRINIVSKCGSMVPIDLSSEEQAILDRAFACETFDEVRALADEIFAREKKIIKRKRHGKNARSPSEILKEIEGFLQEMREHGGFSAIPVEDEDDVDGSIESEEDGVDDLPKRREFREAPPAPMDAEELRERIDEMKERLKALKSKKEKNDAVTDLGDMYEDESSNDDLNDYEAYIEQALKELEEENWVAEDDGDEEVADNDNELASVTDNAFREAEEEFEKHAYGDDEQMLLLEDVPLDKFVAPASRVNKILTEFFNDTPEKCANRGSANIKLQEFLVSERGVINQLVAEFDMRKNADQNARAGVAKSGALNMKRLHAAKLTDDIFARITVVPEGKNHGMLMFFDQSGSMDGIYGKTINQMIILIEFCRRMNIPFSVYGFNDKPESFNVYFGADKLFRAPLAPTPGRVQLSNRQVHLKEYISSGMNAKDYKDALLNLWQIRRYSERPYYEMLHATPLNSAIALSGMLVNKFKQATKVDVVNVLFLTDGDAQDNISMNASEHAFDSGVARVIYNGYASPKYKRSRHASKTCTAAMTRLMSDATGANYLGVFIPSKVVDATKAVGTYHNTNFFGTRVETKTSFSKDGFVMTKNYGFDAFFIIKPLERDNVDEKLSALDGKVPAARLSKAFSKAMSSRMQSRAFLSCFAANLAESSQIKA